MAPYQKTHDKEQKMADINRFEFAGYVDRPPRPYTKDEAFVTIVTRQGGRVQSHEVVVKDAAALVALGAASPKTPVPIDAEGRIDTAWQNGRYFNMRKGEPIPSMETASFRPYSVQTGKAGDNAWLNKNAFTLTCNVIQRPTFGMVAGKDGKEHERAVVRAAFTTGYSKETRRDHYINIIFTDEKNVAALKKIDATRNPEGSEFHRWSMTVDGRTGARPIEVATKDGKMMEGRDGKPVQDFIPTFIGNRFEMERDERSIQKTAEAAAEAPDKAQAVAAPEPKKARSARPAPAREDELEF